MITTIRTFQDNGPYFSCTRGSYQAASLQQLIFHIRQAPDGSCRGIWQFDIEGHMDSAGDAIVDHEGYELLRPSTKEQWMWKRLQELLA